MTDTAKTTAKKTVDTAKDAAKTSAETAKSTVDTAKDTVKQTVDTAKDTVKTTVSATRAQLEQTLDAIDDKFDVKKRSTEAAKRAQTSYEANPVPWIVGATAAAVVVVGLVAWAIFSDD